MDENQNKHESGSVVKRRIVIAIDGSQNAEDALRCKCCLYPSLRGMYMFI